jgi:anti-sigma regulatory factor (Ser/Thr protein kinase)
VGANRCSLAVRLPGEPASVPHARRLIGDLLGRRHSDRADRSGVLLSVSEAFTNAVVHGYPHGGGDIDLSARIEHSLLRVSIRDYGVGADAPSSDRGQGYGMLLIKAHVVDLAVRDCDPGTEVTMTFDLAVR